jgi:mRNA-degrading endonuclease toxin of MazEF toxin-antitoxin module
VEVPLGPEDGLPEPCVVNLDNIATIQLHSLDGLIVSLNWRKLRAVEDALRFALGLAR